jgi:hypothetical protein
MTKATLIFSPNGRTRAIISMIKTGLRGASAGIFRYGRGADRRLWGILEGAFGGIGTNRLRFCILALQFVSK